MGCGSSKGAAAVEQPPASQTKDATLAEEGSAAAATKPVGSVEVYGVTGSMNCMSAVMLADASGCGKLVPCMPHQDTLKPEFLAMNPFHAVPLLKDGDFCLAETNAILHYMAEKYAPAAYPVADAKRCAFIDWALDRFSGVMYADAAKTIYPVLGYVSAPEDQAAAGKTCTENLQEFAKVFLKEKFIGGDKPSIADYRVAPFFFCYAHPQLKEVSCVEVPNRIKQFNKDFAEACSASGLMSVAGGYALKEMLDAKAGSPADMLTVSGIQETVNAALDFVMEIADAFKDKVTAGSGKVEIHGAPGSMNCMGPILIAKHAGCGDMVQCIPGVDTQKPEFLAMNPFHAVPLLKDGDFCLAESSAILRYLAVMYSQDLYPADAKVRGKINWAMDRFSSAMYDDAVKTLYPCFGYAAPPEDRSAAGKACTEHLKEFADVFLKDKFVAGDKLSIADFKVAPFFFAYEHDMVKEQSFVEVPERIRQFNKDFAQACSAAGMLAQAGGFAVKETLDKGDGPAIIANTEEQAPVDPQSGVAENPASSVQQPCGCGFLF